MDKGCEQTLPLDARTARVTDSRAMPWYVTALLVSQSLHFGDYGGMPLKILWAMLDLITIVVLGSGLYLWFVRRKTPVEARIAAIERDEAELSIAASKETVPSPNHPRICGYCAQRSRTQRRRWRPRSGSTG